MSIWLWMCVRCGRELAAPPYEQRLLPQHHHPFFPTHPPVTVSPLPSFHTFPSAPPPVLAVTIAPWQVKAAFMMAYFQPNIQALTRLAVRRYRWLCFLRPSSGILSSARFGFFQGEWWNTSGCQSIVRSLGLPLQAPFLVIMFSSLTQCIHKVQRRGRGKDSKLVAWCHATGSVATRLPADTHPGLQRDKHSKQQSLGPRHNLGLWVWRVHACFCIYFHVCVCVRARTRSSVPFPLPSTLSRTHVPSEILGGMSGESTEDYDLLFTEKQQFYTLVGEVWYGSLYL